MKISLFSYFWLLVLAHFFTGCDQLTLQSEDKKAQPARAQVDGLFSGITSTGLSTSRQLVLFWNPAVSEKKTESFSYQVYQLTSAESPSALLSRLGLEQSSTSERSTDLGIYDFPAGERPSEIGQLIDTVIGATRYEIKDILDQELTHLFQVVAVNLKGEKIGQTKVVVFKSGLGTLDDFSGIESLSSTSHGAVSLSWALSTDERVKGYSIYSGSKFTNLVDSVGSDVSSYEVLEQIPGKKASFGVRAFNAVGQEDSNTKTLSVVVLNNLAPDFEGITLAQLQNGNDAVLSWQPASGNPSEYRVYQGTTENALAADVNVVDLLTPVATVEAPSVSYTVTGLGDDQQHHFVVRAAAAGGALDQNVAVKMVSVPDLGPPNFSGISGLEVVSGGIEVAWEKPSDQVSSYRIYASRSGSLSFTSLNQKAQVSASEVSRVLNGLEDNSTWMVGVRAVDKHGNEDGNTASLSVTVKDLTPPQFLGFVGVGAQQIPTSETSLRVFFKRSAEADVASYSVRVRKNGTSDAFTEVYTAPQPSSGDITADISGLAGNTAYDIRVKVIDTSSNVSVSDQTVTATTADLTPPVFFGVETVVRDTDVSPLVVDVSWSSPAAGDASFYRVYYSKDSFLGESFSKDDTFPLSVNGKTIESKLVTGNGSIGTGFNIGSDLDEDSTYYFVVRATDVAGNEDSNTVERSVLIPVMSPPTFSGVESASVASATRNVLLGWTEPDASNAASQYLVYVSSTPSTPRVWHGPVTVPAPATSFTVTEDPEDGLPLDELTNYYFRVNAKNVAGIVDTNIVERVVTVPDVTAPTFSGLSSVTIDGVNESLVLKFSAASDTQGVGDYEVFWRELPSGIFPGTSGKTVSHGVACPGLPADQNCEIEVSTADGLVAGTQYEFRVDVSDVNAPPNIHVSDALVSELFPDFAPPADPSGVTKSPEPAGITNIRNYTVSGTGTDGLIVRVYCENLDTNTTLELSECGGFQALSGSTSFSVPVTIPDVSASYQLKAVHYKSENGKESQPVNAGSIITLDRTPPSLVAFSGCASGLCLDVTSIGGASSDVPAATMSFTADAGGTWELKEGAAVRKSGVMVANTRYDVPISALDLGNTDGAHALSFTMTDAAGNTSDASPLTITVDNSPPNLVASSFLVYRIEKEDRYEFKWSGNGLGTSDTLTLTKRVGATAPDSVIPAETLEADLPKTTESAEASGAASDGTPVSFSLFACDPIGNCARSSVIIDGSLSDIQNDSEGDTARYIFSTSGGGTPVLAWSENKTNLEVWDGLSAPGDPVVVTSGDAGCVSPATTGCSVDFSGDDVDPWEKRYLRVALPSSNPSSDGQSVDFSSVYVFGRVPDGMVYVDKDAWPEEEGMTFKDWEKFSFAVDKYETQLTSGTLDGSSTVSSGGNGILESVATGAPAINLNWYAHKRGCLNRSANYPTFTGSSEARKIRLATGLEWTVAAHGTPDQGGQGFCNVDNRGFPAAPDATGTSDNSGCVSTFGARNMIGNQWEWTDELLTDRNFIRFYGVSDNAEVETIAAPIFSEVIGNTSVLDWDPFTAFPKIGTRSGPWTGTEDQVWQNWGAASALPQTSLARAALRGGFWNDGSNAGRFALYLGTGPSSTYSDIGGRCSLASPAPGQVRFRSHSEADKARFTWRLWGEPETTVVRLAFAKSEADIDGWDGASSGASLTDDLYTVSDFSGCTETGYNSEGFEVLGTGSTTSGSLGLQGRCGVDISGLDPWEKRWVRLHASNSYGEVFSDTFVIARVPSGMVFVAAEDWPDPSKHRAASEYGESYSTPYDFAIDKYETSISGSVPNCTTEDFPCTTGGFTGHLESTGAVPAGDLNWYSHKQGCDNRTAVLGATWADTGLTSGDPSGRRVHLATGLEWTVASFETPDSIGPQFCHIHNSFWNPGTPASQTQTGTNSMERCLSRYGARNMIGNQWEWTNDLADSGVMYSFWTGSPSIDSGVDIGLAGSWNVAEGYVTGWDFDLAFPVSSSSTQASAFHSSDYFYEISGALSTYGAKARAARRGGAWYYGSNAGRFAVYLDLGPTRTSSFIGGRCSLASPAP